ncbi:tRNAHis guanylyltransferase Thg1 [Kipferlia bialata]|uniref:tRNAHis guanylyltransferase Thg1 n=1 Tax=Kipferlia bialata TaxID=797122 RepID=A0A391NQ88_9EUKA|nr:tRNAHis guanylyltransferase Thg1 [Kipferlia bialata]|eukprot:g11427.t1
MPEATRESLGDWMKRLEVESLTVTHLMPYHSYVLRLDGKNFSTFTTGFRKPFDPLFLDVMLRTTTDVAKKFQVPVSYTHSDEISLLFPAVCTQEEYERADPGKRVEPREYKGRVIKLLTLTAAYTSARFNYWMASLVGEHRAAYALTMSQKDLEAFCGKLTAHECMFDSRLVLLTDPKELVLHQIWRHRDCYRNSVSSIARHLLTKEQIFGRKTGDMVAMMEAEGGEDVLAEYQPYLAGFYVKRERYEAEVEYTRNGEVHKVVATRSRHTPRQYEVTQYTDATHTLTTAPVWD